MAYNAKTDGVRISTSASYPSDTLLTSGMHALLTELAAVGLIIFTTSAIAPVGPTVNQVWYRPDTGLGASTSPLADAAVFRWTGSAWAAMTPTQFATYLTTLAPAAGLNYTAAAIDPVAPSTGDWWKNTAATTVSGVGAGETSFWNGAAWQQVTGGVISFALGSVV